VETAVEAEKYLLLTHMDSILRVTFHTTMKVVNPDPGDREDQVGRGVFREMAAILGRAQHILIATCQKCIMDFRVELNQVRGPEM
jgi:hypothetical protein